MNPVQKYIIKYGMQTVLQFLSFFARRNSFSGISDWLTGGLAHMVARQKQIRPAASVHELGAIWQKAFASPKMIPITGEDEKTVYAEIRIQCPLRGTGDTIACYRMMNFDRNILEKAGGQFIVVQSQASPGISHCKVAMRMQGTPTDDLLPAHLVGSTVQ